MSDRELTTENQDYLRGMKDCIAGKPHEVGQSMEYTEGYSNQYYNEQSLTNRSENNGS